MILNSKLQKIFEKEKRRLGLEDTIINFEIISQEIDYTAPTWEFKWQLEELGSGVRLEEDGSYKFRINIYDYKQPGRFDALFRHELYHISKEHYKKTRDHYRFRYFLFELTAILYAFTGIKTI